MGIPNSSACTLCVDGEVAMATGQANYSVIDSEGRNRWGDYQGASNDSDFLRIWVEGEYVAFTDGWGKDIEPTYNSYFPIDTAAPNPVSFGNQPIFSNATTQFVAFTNTGNATMYTSSAEISGDADFFITADGCSFQTVQPGNSCFEGVSFTPKTIGAGTASVVLFDTTSSGFASSALTGTGVQAGTTTSLSSNLNPSTFGQPVTFTARVASTTSGTPTGTVTFFNGSSSLGTIDLSGGTAQFSTSSLGGGANSITAKYNGSTLYLSSMSITETVQPAPSSAKVVSSLNPSTFGRTVKFSATVASGLGTPGGTVTFKNGPSTLGTASLSGGIAAFTTSALTAGTHSITAVYNGSANVAASTSAAISQIVQKVGTASMVTSSLNPSSFHQTVTLTAKVTSVGGVPAGTVTFKNGPTVLGTPTLSGSGVATQATNALTVESDTITVVYNGNGNFGASTSSALAQTVKKATSTTGLVSSKNPSTHGTAVTFTATITPAFGGAATGKVTFKDGATVLGTGSINASNKAAFTTSTLAVGTHSLAAAYPGDTHFQASTSPVLKQVVK